MNRVQKLCLILSVVLSGTVAFAQNTRNLTMPAQVNMTQSGWNATLQNGNLTLGLPLTVAPGEVAIPVALGLNATYTATSKMIGIPDPITGRTIHEQFEVDRPINGGMHFGYISDASLYGSVDGGDIQGLTVLESGVQIADNQWTAFSATFGIKLNLPQAYGFTAVNSDSAMVDPTATYLTYVTAASGLGQTYQAMVGNLPLSDFGVGNSNYKVVIDKDRARIYGYATSLHAWVPLIWADRFKHYVTFKWAHSTTGLTSDIKSITSVTALNQRSKGVVLRWAEYVSSALEVDILRLDFVGMYGPSVYIKGYPGPATVAPLGFVSTLPNASEHAFVVPAMVGASFRPTLIQVGAYGSVNQPVWGSCGPAGPGAPSSDGTSDSTMRTWSFTYDGAQAELASFTQPNRLKTNFSYTDSPYQPTPTGQAQFRSLSLVQAVDSAGTQQTTRWTRIFPVGTSQMTITLENWWDTSSKSLNPDRYHQLAIETDPLNYGNGVYQTDTLMDLSNKVWNTTTYSYSTNGAGVNASLSSVDSVTVAPTGAPSRTTSFGYVNGMRLAVTSQKVFAAGTYKVSSVAYTDGSRMDMLAKGQPSEIDTTMYQSDGVTPVLPATQQMNVFDSPTTGVPLLQLQTSYLSSTIALHGTNYSYDTDGHLAGTTIYHANGQVLPSPSSTSMNFDPSSGALASSSITDLTVNPQVSLGQTMGGFDSAGRATTVTENTTTGTQTTNLVTTTYRYDDRGRVLSISRPGSPAVSYFYGPDEQTVAITTDGLTTTNSYDGFGRLIQVQKPNGVNASYTYDQDGRLSNITETNSAKQSRGQGWGYDPLDRVTSQKPIVGGTTTTTYVADGVNLKVTTTRGSQVTTTWLDPLGRVMQVTAPDGSISTTSYVYTTAGYQMNLVTTMTTKSGTWSQTRSWSYDLLGRLISKTEPETNLQTFSGFNAMNQPTSVTEGANTTDARTRTINYDGFGRMIKISNGLDFIENKYTGPNLTHATRTVGGNLSSQDFTFGGVGGLLSSETTTQADGTSTMNQYAYYPNGLLQTLTYPATSTYPSGRTIDYAYDSLDRPYSIINNKGAYIVNSTTYDAWGNRSQIAFASGAKDTWTMDPATGSQLGNWVCSYSPGGLTNGPDTRGYTYDPVTNLLTSAGEWTNLVNDPMTGRLTEADGFGLQTSHAYDSFGNAIFHNATQAFGQEPSTLNNFQFAPLQNNQIPKMETNSTAAPTGWIPNYRGEATQIGVGSGNPLPAIGLTWDGLGLVGKVTTKLTSQTYQYAPSGTRVRVTDSTDSTNDRRYAYTSGGLLLSEYSLPKNVQLGQKALKIPHNPAQFSGCGKYLGTFSANETVTATVWFKAPCGVHGEMFVGDAGGADPYDQCSYTSAMGNGDWQQLTITHTMTHADQMWVYLYSDQWSVPDPTKVPAHAGTAYDALLVIGVAGSVSRVVLDDSFEGNWPNTATTSLDSGPWVSGVDGILFDSSSSGSQITWRRDIVYLGSLAVAEIEEHGVHELHSDHLGTPRLITKGAGDWASNLVGTSEATQAYGPYGELIAQAGNYVPTTGYTGHIQTDATGLIYMRGRYYSPAWHRFVNSDQGADPNSWNQMAYAGGSPFMMVDPSGFDMDVWDFGGADDGSDDNPGPASQETTAPGGVPISGPMPPSGPVIAGQNAGTIPTAGATVGITGDAPEDSAMAQSGEVTAANLPGMNNPGDWPSPPNTGWAFKSWTFGPYQRSCMTDCYGNRYLYRGLSYGKGGVIGYQSGSGDISTYNGTPVSERDYVQFLTGWSGSAGATYFNGFGSTASSLPNISNSTEWTTGTPGVGAGYGYTQLVALHRF